MDIQGTQKMVVIGCINFEDHALIKKQHACEKMNLMGKKLNNQKNRCNHQKWFSFLAKSCKRF